MKPNRKNRLYLGIATGLSIAAAAGVHTLPAAAGAPLGNLSPIDALQAFETEPGSYETWRGRTSPMATNAIPQITEAFLKLLEFSKR